METAVSPREAIFQLHLPRLLARPRRWHHRGNLPSLPTLGYRGRVWKVARRHGDLFEKDRKQLDAERRLRESEKLTSIGMPSGGISQDYNNLLTIIQSNLELVRLRSADPEIRALAEQSLQADERGARLLSQMLAFARQPPFSPQITDVNTTIIEIEA